MHFYHCVRRCNTICPHFLLKLEFDENKIRASDKIQVFNFPATAGSAKPPPPPPESVSLDDIRSAFSEFDKSTEPPAPEQPPPQAAPPPGSDSISFGSKPEAATTDTEPEDFLQRFKAASPMANDINDAADSLQQITESVKVSQADFFDFGPTPYLLRIRNICQ